MQSREWHIWNKSNLQMVTCVRSARIQGRPGTKGICFIIPTNGLLQGLSHNGGLQGRINKEKCCLVDICITQLTFSGPFVTFLLKIISWFFCLWVRFTFFFQHGIQSPIKAKSHLLRQTYLLPQICYTPYRPCTSTSPCLCSSGPDILAEIPSSRHPLQPGEIPFNPSRVSSNRLFPQSPLCSDIYADCIISSI